MNRARCVTGLLIIASTPLIAGCGGADSARSTQQNAGEWTPLFDGASLEGWHNPYAWGEAWVEEGEIRLRANRKFFLMNDDAYDDFELEAEVRLPDAESNSGIMFRAHIEPNNVFGYQAEIDPTDRAWSGGLYDEGRRGWLNPDREDSASVEAFRARAAGLFRLDDWNRYRIRAVGDSIHIILNGMLTTAYHDGADASGFVGIQHHGEEGKIYRFRNLRIRRINS